MAINSLQIDSGFNASSFEVSQIDFTQSLQAREPSAPTLEEVRRLSAPITTLFSEIKDSIDNPRPFDPKRASSFETLVEHLESKQQIHLNKRTRDACLERELAPRDSFSLDYLNIDIPSAKANEFRKVDSFISEESIATALSESTENYDKINTLEDILFYSYSKNPHNLPLRTKQLAKAVLEDTYSIKIDEETPIGKGSFGSIYSGIVCEEPCAIKRPIRIDNSHHREYQALLALKDHPYILKMLSGNESELILELAGGGSLEKTKQSLNAGDLLKILFQSADAIAYMHEKGFIHRDIHTGNILLTDQKDARLSDFGTAITLDAFNPKTDGGGTIRCMAPEILMTTAPKREHFQKMDTWSFGIMIWHLLSKDSLGTPYDDKISYKNDIQLMRELKKHLMSFTGFEPAELQSQLDPKKLAKYDPDGRLTSVMIHCLTINPEERPSMANIRDLLKTMNEPVATPMTPPSSRFTITPVTPASSRFSVTSTTVKDTPPPTPSLSRFSVTSTLVKDTPPPTPAPSRFNVTNITVKDTATRTPPL